MEQVSSIQDLVMIEVGCRRGICLKLHTEGSSEISVYFITTLNIFIAKFAEVTFDPDVIAYNQLTGKPQNYFHQDSQRTMKRTLLLTVTIPLP
jgi:hypothetical protein